MFEPHDDHSTATPNRPDPEPADTGPGHGHSSSGHWISVLGLGAMGAALAEALLGAGREVTVWNRSAEKAAPFAGRGAGIAGSAAEAIGAAPLVIICLLDYAAVRDVLSGAVDQLVGRTIVNLTNGTPQDARDIATWVEDQGASYIDGGIMAVPPMIGSPDAFILYSGTAEAFDDYRQTLEILGATQFLGPDAGLAPLYDLALLSAMYGLFGGFLHATALAGSEKVEAGRFTEMLVPWLNAMTGVLPEIARQIDTHNYAAADGSNLAMQAVAIENIIATSNAQGVDSGLIVPMRALMAHRIACGFGGNDIAGLYRVVASRKRDDNCG
ncbi:NAD(P)-dependent oxidoreductase [Neoaquamicrobium sediminum]|uniref:NAD(P)-binding domain-containing protein n=1 Tax=Neoaquamicrobium sediminum TaxID=1849104 RepID=A0ABV3WNS2_9HYPH